FSNDERLAYTDLDWNVHLLHLSAPDPLADTVVLTARSDKTVRFIEYFDGSKIAFSRDGRWLGYSDYTSGGTIKLWDTTSADPASTIRILPAKDREIRFSPGGHWLAIRSEGQVQLWNMATLGMSPTLTLPNPSGDFGFSPDDRWFVTAGVDRGEVAGENAASAELWDLQSPQSHATLSLPNGRYPIAFSPHSRWLAISSPGDRDTLLVELISVTSTTVPRVLGGAGQPQTFSPDSTQLLTSVDKVAMIWDLAAEGSAAAPLALRGHTGPVRISGFSADGRSVVTADTDYTVRQWDLAALRPVRIEQPSDYRLLIEDASRFMSMQPNGQNSVRVWDQVDTRTPRSFRLPFRQYISSQDVSLSPNGHMLAID